MTATPTNPEYTLIDLLPDYCSYLYDIERCLEASGDIESYRNNPVPVLVDLLMDFGTLPAGVSPEEYEQIAQAAAEHYAGKRS